jgi:hypothetical protein
MKTRLIDRAEWVPGMGDEDKKEEGGDDLPE